MKAPKFYRDRPDAKEQERFYRDVAQSINTLLSRVAEAQPDSTATDVAGIVADFNAFLAKCRSAGLQSE
jgi:hypothetical protein